MAHRDRVSRCFLSVTLLMFLLTLVANVTTVSNFDEIAHQSDVVDSELEREEIPLAGTPHAPIAIDGDANFTDTALLEGWHGDGSPENPFIIDRLDIDLGGNNGSCISITNTQVSFIISNCNLTGAIYYIIEHRGYAGAGIFLENVTNCELVKNIIDSDAYGIAVVNSKNSTITDNTCYGSSHFSSIGLEGSTYNSIANNTCNDNEYDGIRLGGSSYNIVANNTCNNNAALGISLRESEFNLIYDNTCTNNTSGIYISNSNSNTVTNNTCTRNDQGIFIDASNNNTVTNNTCANNRIGIFLWDSHFNKVENNIYLNNTEHDITVGSDYFSHDPFNITSNEDFINQGWPGSGTADDPFIISNLSIEWSFIPSPCVGIFNTTSYFVIEDCRFEGVSSGMGVFYGTGVLLANVTNGVLENNRFFEGEYGILLDDVAHCRISNNMCTSNRIGIWLESSNSITVVNNTCSSNEIGISLDESDSNNMANNTCTSNVWGIWLAGSNSNKVVNNTCNSNIEDGISLPDGNSNTVSDNTCNNNRWGIWLAGSDSNKVVNNTCTSNDIVGIELSESENNTVVDNTCNSNERGIWLGSSDSNTVANNTCNDNYKGIELRNSDFNTISNNTCNDNTGSGIYLIASTDSLIVDNSIYNNTEIGIFLNGNCAHNRIYGNKIGWNGQNAICDGSYNSWDDGISRGNSWSDYNFTSQYIVPGEGQCIDYYPFPWFSRTYKGPVIFLLGGVLFLLPLGIVLGSRRHIAFDIIQRISYRLVFWFSKRKDCQDDIVVPARYLLVSRLRKRWSIKHEAVDESR